VAIRSEADMSVIEQPFLIPTLGIASLNLFLGIGFSLPEGILESVGCVFDQPKLS
jgi:hypothetical protein